MIDKEPWHLDKKVPIAFIVALLIQTGSILWYGGKVVERVETNSTNISLLYQKSKECDDKTDDLGGRIGGNASTLARVDERTKAIQEAMRDLKEAIKQLK